MKNIKMIKTDVKWRKENSKERLQTIERERDKKLCLIRNMIKKIYEK